MDSNKKNQAPESEAQESQYSFPYHYMPVVNGMDFQQHRFWSRGVRYLGRLKVVFDLMLGIEFSSLLDIGCGDGRFLRELSRKNSDKKLAGIDTSLKAIKLAKQLNPKLEFERRDILSSPLSSQWDVITLMEVIEHIPPKLLPDFMKETASLIRPGGHMIITVPHVNEKLIPKHYQHFDSDSLRAMLPDDLEVCRFVYFDHISVFLRIFSKIMGGSGKFFIITCQFLNNFLYKHYMENCLYGGEQHRRKKIAVMAQKKPATQTEKSIGADY